MRARPDQPLERHQHQGVPLAPHWRAAPLANLEAHIPKARCVHLDEARSQVLLVLLQSLHCVCVRLELGESLSRRPAVGIVHDVYAVWRNTQVTEELCDLARRGFPWQATQAHDWVEFPCSTVVRLLVVEPPRERAPQSLLLDVLHAKLRAQHIPAHESQRSSWGLKLGAARQVIGGDAPP